MIEVIGIIVLVSFVPRTRAWGEYGHEIIANLAWRRLHSSTQHQIVSLLNITNATLIEETGSPLAAVSNWADHVRHFLPWSASKHYIDVRDNLIHGGCHYDDVFGSDGNKKDSTSCMFQYKRDCPEDDCVAGAILNYSTQLLQYQVGGSLSSSHFQFDRHLRESTSISNRVSRSRDIYHAQQALKFLIHFIGDIHQPLHVSRTTDKGGNDISVQYHLLQQPPRTPPSASSRDSTALTIISGFVVNHHHHHHHSWNLHSIWDTALIETALEETYDRQRKNMEDELESMLQQHPEWVKKYASCNRRHNSNVGEFVAAATGLNITCVIEWGQESWEDALKYAYTLNDPWESNDNGEPAVDVKDGDEIGRHYYKSRIGVVKERLIAGGVRLGLTLDAIFESKRESHSAVSVEDMGGSVLSLWTKLRIANGGG